jgi:photosystem II stability/assembly factor-like uncharacterized protein
MLKTTDGGDSWMSQNTFTQKNFSSIFFIDSITGWAAGFNGLLMKTTDGGNNWTNKWNNDQTWFTSVFFHNNLNGWLGSLDSLYQTNDGGETWSVNINHPATDIQFINMDEGWFCYFFIVCRTTDGGISWTEYNTGSLEELYSIYFINSYIGWGVGANGKIVKTYNGGITWENQMSFTTRVLSSVFFQDENVGWITGESGIILKTTNGGVVWVEESNQTQIISQFYLNQNYPNPFNPNTKIKFSIPQSSQVVIKVFDILGSEIETLVNEEKPAGIYEITWYAGQLPSGVYFYQLRAGSFVKTKKMVLMK